MCPHIPPDRTRGVNGEMSFGRGPQSTAPRTPANHGFFGKHACHCERHDGNCGRVTP